MRNTKTEFLSHVNSKDVLCATISGKVPDGYIILTTGWTKEEYDEFIIGMDFEYDAGYGGQELYGTIWYTDGTWSSRGEYDGSEWWEHHKCPEIPIELNRVDKVREQKLNKILK